MKLKYIILSFAAIALLAGCSKSRTEVQQPDPAVDPDSDAWVNDESLPVPVNFSAPQIGVVSKAYAEEVTDLAGLQVGVYGLRTVDGVLSWSPDDPDSYITDLLNRVAVVGSPSADEKSYLTFKTGEYDLTVYYPMVSTYTYSFYGYYPRRTPVEETEDGCIVTYENIGGIDILWDEDHAQAFQDGVKGFNAAYIRKAKSGGVWNNEAMNFTPNFSFQHMLTGLRFYAQSKNEAVCEDVTVTGLRLVEIPTSVKLAVASTDVSGAITPVEESIGTIPLTSADGSGLNVKPNNTENNGNGALLGTLMVCPDESYKMEVDLRLGNGSTTTFNIETPVKADGYVGGSMYSLLIKINSPVEVEISVDVEDWDDGGIVDDPSLEIG